MSDQLQDLIDRVGGMRRIGILAIGVAAIAGILFISRWATAPVWAPVYTNLPIETVGTLTDRLDQAGIKFKLDRGGADLLVASGDVARARVALARDGGLPNAGRPGLELFDQPSWSMTDFTQRINYRRALEGELERTIGHMRGIEAAQVHLALHESQSFGASATPEEASVVLKVTTDVPAPEVVSGIAHLVASSVDGMKTENVTIVDDAGHLLSESQEGTSVAATTSRQLKIQRDLETHLAKKAEELLWQMVGRGNARVQIAASMNFDQIERTTQTIDPDKQAIVTDQKAEIIPGATGGAASTNSATSYENTKSTETFAAATGSVVRLTVAVLVNDRLSGADSTATFHSRSAEELARIDAMVRNAVGIDTTRGDMMSVVSVPFGDGKLAAPIEAPTPSMFEVIKEYRQPATGTLALAMAFLVALFALRSARSATPAPAPARRLTPAPSQGALPPGAPTSASTSTLLQASAIEASASAATRDRLAHAVDARPEDATRLVRAWLKS